MRAAGWGEVVARVAIVVDREAGRGGGGVGVGLWYWGWHQRGVGANTGLDVARHGHIHEGTARIEMSLDLIIC